MDTFKNRLIKAMEVRGIKPVDLANLTGLSKASISQYINGVYEAKQKALYSLAKALGVSEAWLMGYDVSMDSDSILSLKNVKSIEKKRYPLLGTIAAGKPILAEECYEYCVESGDNIDADFCLRIKGDSMVDARIYDGDVVFIREQPSVNDGEIAAVLVDDEATLKRVYINDHQIMLVSANPNYKPMIYKNGSCGEVRILGKAVAFISRL